MPQEEGAERASGNVLLRIREEKRRGEVHRSRDRTGPRYSEREETRRACWGDERREALSGSERRKRRSTELSAEEGLGAFRITTLFSSFRSTAQQSLDLNT